jgi:hypothetical protein
MASAHEDMVFIDFYQLVEPLPSQPSTMRRLH